MDALAGDDVRDVVVDSGFCSSPLLLTMLSFSVGSRSDFSFIEFVSESSREIFTFTFSFSKAGTLSERDTDMGWISGSALLTPVTIAVGLLFIIVDEVDGSGIVIDIGCDDDVDDDDADDSDEEVMVDIIGMLSVFLMLASLRGTLAGVGAGGKELMGLATPPRDMSRGGASRPESHSSAVRAGWSLAVSGYRSDWKASPCT